MHTYHEKNERWTNLHFTSWTPINDINYAKQPTMLFNKALKYFLYAASIILHADKTATNWVAIFKRFIIAHNILELKIMGSIIARDGWTMMIIFHETFFVVVVAHEWNLCLMLNGNLFKLFFMCFFIFANEFTGIK